MTQINGTPKPWRDIWLTIGLVAMMALGLAGLAAATGWEETWASIRRLTAPEVALLLGLAFSNYILRAFRWQLYCRVQRIPVEFPQTLRHYLGGFALTATPGRVGELVRLRWITLETGAPFERTGALVVVDRAADLAAMGLLTAVAVAFSTTGLAGGIPVAVLSVIAAIVVTRASLLIAALELGWRLIGRWPKLFGKARRAAQSLRPFSAWQIVLPALLLGGLGWFAEGYSFYLLLGWMGAEVSLWTAVGIFLIAMVTGGATGAPGGLGGAEAAMVALLTIEGVPLSVSIPATAVIRLTTLWFAIAIGLAMFPIATRCAMRGAHAT